MHSRLLSFALQHLNFTFKIIIHISLYFGAQVDGKHISTNVAFPVKMQQKRGLFQKWRNLDFIISQSITISVSGSNCNNNFSAACSLIFCILQWFYCVGYHNHFTTMADLSFDKMLNTSNALSRITATML